ncbi:MAG TPA: Ig-like domain-containing protein, partial [Rubricoccaceae bacterium]
MSPAADVSAEEADSLSAEVEAEPDVAADNVAGDGSTSPYALPLAPSVTATLAAALADPADTEVNPGDVLRYIATITNAGADAALGLAYTGTLDANTTLVPGSVRISPLASSDAYPGAYAGIAFEVSAAAGLLANDSGGIPAATVASFGGGAVGGTVATNAAGTAAAFGTGGSLTVNADGSYALTAPTGFTGPLTFEYRLANSAGGDVATVTVTVTVPVAPTAAPDGPTATSAPGAPYHTAFNTAFALAAPGILANDDLGTPTATITSFGGGSLGGAVTTNAAGTTAAFGTGGALTVGADGAVAFTPPSGFTGLFTF